MHLGSTLTARFAVIFLALAIYTANWECNQPVVPRIRISDHFDYNYGFPFACVGFVSALLIFSLNAFYWPATGAEIKPAPKSVAVIALTLITGIVAVTAGSVGIAAGNDAFTAKVIDPDVNPCAGQKQINSGPGDAYFNNVNCMKDNVVQTLEQAGANVTRGYKGLLDAGNRVPIIESYDKAGLCPVNVHWHLGAEHLSVGEFDEHGTGPAVNESSSHRRLGERLGFRCHHYDSHDPKFTTPYEWKYCKHMEIGETYEVHWPHSAAGACGTKYQYQTPFVRARLLSNSGPTTRVHACQPIDLVIALPPCAVRWRVLQGWHHQDRPAQHVQEDRCPGSDVHHCQRRGLLLP